MIPCIFIGACPGSVCIRHHPGRETCCGNTTPLTTESPHHGCQACLREPSLKPSYSPPHYSHLPVIPAKVVLHVMANCLWWTAGLKISRNQISSTSTPRRVNLLVSVLCPNCGNEIKLDSIRLIVFNRGFRIKQTLIISPPFNGRQIKKKNIQ